MIMMKMITKMMIMRVSSKKLRTKMPTSRRSSYIRIELSLERILLFSGGRSGLMCGN